MEILSNENGWISLRANGFSVFKTFDCGQCFRFDPVEDENFDYRVDGVAFGRHVSFAQRGEELFIRTSREDLESIWIPYLQLDVDYDSINKRIVDTLPEKTERICS